MKQARQMLEVAAANLQLGYYETVINRSYYAVFYVATALLLTIGQTRSKHHGVMGAFGQYFIKTDLWPVEFGDMYSRLIRLRETADYTVSVAIPQMAAEARLAEARQFVEKGESWLTAERWL